jgi:hypothetical protein
MKTRNIVLIGVAAVALAAAAALWWVYASRDALVKQAIERYGPQITGVTLTVKSVDFEPAQGKGAITGLQLGNPPGYKSPRAFTLAEMRLAIDFSTITSNVVHLTEVSLDAPVITYERGSGTDNLRVIQKHIDAQAAKSSGPGRKFIIDNLHIRNGRVNFSDTLSLPMPDVHLRDVGKKSNGATVGEIVNQVWDALVQNITSLSARALGAAKEGAGSAVDSVRGLFK